MIHIHTHTHIYTTNMHTHAHMHTSLSHTMMDNALPEDSIAIGSWLAQIRAAFKALQKVQLLREGS